MNERAYSDILAALLPGGSICNLLQVLSPPNISRYLQPWAIDYRWDNRHFWLSTNDCQVPTQTSQNLKLEQQIRIFGADKLINCLED
jgi:hypothetical protein